MKQFLMDGFLTSGKLNSQNSVNPQGQKSTKSSKNGNITQQNDDKIQKRKMIIDDNQEDPDLNKNLLPKAEKEKKVESIPKNKLVKEDEKSLPFMNLINVLIKVENSKGENSKDAIKTLFECCDDNYSDCRNCPLYQNICWGIDYEDVRAPYSWQLIE